MRKIDFHTHILPRMDDGAASSEESAQMLRRLAQQQVDTVVLTPHYYSHREPLSKFVKRRAASYERVLQVAETKMHLPLGAEVYLSEYLFNNADLMPLCIEGTHVMLLELPYERPIDDSVIDSVDRVASEYVIKPVIAHVERYPSLMRSNKRIELLLEIGCVLQVNLSSCLGWGSRHVVSLFKKGYIGAVGTDAHNMSSRPPNYLEGFSHLQRALPEEILQKVQYSMESLLEKY